MFQNLEHNRRWKRTARWTVLITLLVAGPFVVTVLRFPVLVLEPGPAPDVAERSRILTSTFRSSGSFHLTTVQIKRPDGSTVYDALEALFDPDKILVTRASVYPPGSSDERIQKVQTAQMVQSEVSAEAAAFEALGIEYALDGVLVVDVLSGTPAADVLEPGDLIVEVDGMAVESIDDLAASISTRRAGEEVLVTVERAGDTEGRSVRTVVDEETEETVIGVGVSQHHSAPVDIEFDAAEIGGPSAGLMYALSIYDRLDEGDLTGGRTIAGTGTIDSVDGRSGVVGGVGAVRLKVRAAMNIGADVFLAPVDSVREARAVAGSSMQVIGVETLKGAIEDLEALAPVRAERKFRKTA